MNVFAFQVVFVAILLTHGICSAIEDDNADAVNAVISRAKRFLYFPYNSCIAFAVVLAIPLSLKNRNVYMSYNFETNYYLAYFDVNQGLVPLPFATIDEPGVNAGTFNDPNRIGNNPFRERNLEKAAYIDNDSSTNSTTQSSVVIESTATTATNKSTETRKTKTNKTTTKPQSENEKIILRKERHILDTLMSRKRLYKILMDKMEKAGFNGEECLLKAICEAAEQPFGDHNGVLGDIVHIIFSPSTSRDEKLSKEYYKAERDGQAGFCHRYATFCQFGMLELITETLIK